MTPSQRAVIDLYLGSFAARHAAYVKNSSAHIPEPLDPELAYAALGSGGFSISGYMARWIEHKDQRHCLTHVGAIDFDMEDGLDQAKNVQATMAETGIRSLLVSSRRGGHLWISTVGHDTVHDSMVGMVPAAYVRRALRAALKLTGIDDPKAEIFPKKSRSDWGVRALRMPLMRHPKTGIRYPAYDGGREVTRITPLVEMMADVQAGTPFKAVSALAGPDEADITYPSPTGPYRRPSSATGDTPGVTELLNARYGLQTTAGRTIRCPFHDDHHASLQIAGDDERLWCKAPECDMYNDGRGVGSVALSKRFDEQKGMPA